MTASHPKKYDLLKIPLAKSNNIRLEKNKRNKRRHIQLYNPPQVQIQLQANQRDADLFRPSLQRRKYRIKQANKKLTTRYNPEIQL
jgi:hypothetical protein